MASGRRFGKYLLHDRIAVGGMGELFLATEVGAARGTPPVVLKILLPEYSADAEYVSMFHDEARIGMQLAHPNVVAVHDLGRVPEGTFLVLEYVHGEDLRSLQYRLEDVGMKFPPETALRIIVEVLHGLDHAHRVKDSRGKSLNLVHRDLSPDNVMISFDGDVKVLDFGIAKADGRATQTQFGMLKGKAQYMSPEQALGQAVDARSDLYAVGLVLLELLTGTRRFTAETDPVQMIRDARTWMPKPPSETNPALPIELDAIVMKAMQQEPARRWQTAEDFASALTRTLRGGGVPRAKEHLPAMMRRLFPDRAEPFLQAPATAPAKKAAATPRNVVGAVGDVSAEELPSEEQLLGVFLSRGEKNKPMAAFRAPSDDVTDTAEATTESAETTQESQAETTQESTVVGAPALDSERTVVGVKGLAPLPMPTDSPARPAARLGAAQVTSLGMPPVPPSKIPAPPSATSVPEGRARKSSPPPPPRPARVDDEMADREEIGTRVGVGALDARPVRTNKVNVDVDPPTGSSRASRPSNPERKRKGAGGGSFLLIVMAFVLVAAGVAIALRKPIQARLAALGAGPAETPTAAPMEEVIAVSAVTATPTDVALAIPAEETAAEEAVIPVLEATATATAMESETSSAAKGGGRFPGEVVEDVETPSITAPEPVATRTPAVKRPKPTPTTAAAARSMASVRILSKPSGMEILVDGNPTGKRTPATVPVEPGNRTLSLRAPGFRPWSFNEDFSAGDTLQLQADLNPE